MVLDFRLRTTIDHVRWNPGVGRSVTEPLQRHVRDARFGNGHDLRWEYVVDQAICVGILLYSVASDSLGLV